MSTQVRNAGLAAMTDTNQWGGRQAFTLSNDNCLLLVHDNNNSSSASGYGDRTDVPKLYIYESSNRTTWTLRATISTVPGGTIGRITGALFADNSLGIFHHGTNGATISYCKLTYSGYTVSAWETVANAATTLAGSAVRRFDALVTDTNVPICMAYLSSTTTKTAAYYVKRTSDNTWVASSQTTSIAQNAYSSGAAVSICAPGGTATARAVVSVFGDSNPGSSADYGIKLFTMLINESTGAITSYTSRATYYNGEALGGTTSTKDQQREVKLFNTGASGEYTLGIMHGEVNRRLGVTRGTIVGTTWTTTVPLSDSFIGSAAVNVGDRSFAIAATNETVTFFCAIKNSGGYGHYQIIDYPARISRVTNSVRWPALRGFWNDNVSHVADTAQIYAGGDRNFTIANVDTLTRVWISSTQLHNDHMYSFPGTIPPVQTKPAAGSTMTTSNPALSVKADTNRADKQTATKIQWQFAKDSLFTTNLTTYLQDDSKYKDVNGTDVSGVTVTYTDTLPGAYDLPQGLWYVRSALVDENDQVGPYSLSSTFTVSHQPAATGLSPANSDLYSYGSGSRSFSWKFTDPSSGDYQTAYQIIVERNDTGATVVDSGKVSSGNTSGTLTIPATSKDIILQWRVRLWDSDDVVGAYSSYALFRMSDPPVVNLTTPVNGGVLTSGVPTITFNSTMGGGRVITGYTVYVMQGSRVVWSVARSGLSLTSGTSRTETATKSYLTNLQSYTYYVKVTDSLGLQGTSARYAVSTSWVTPAAPAGLAVDASQYNVEDAGYVNVSWNDTGRDVDFSGWHIYRRDNLINPATGAIQQAGAWNLIYTEYDTAINYTYRDYMAPANYQVDYRITQEVNRFGDSVESSNQNFTSVTPKSEGYWLVTPQIGDVAATAFKLAVVTADSYTDEWEQEVYPVIGRGRHIDRGQHLGMNGSLTAQLRDTPTQTARQKKLRIETIREQVAILWLRNPFGDSFPVAVGDIDVSRIAGVGTSEFCDVTIPYSEVGL